MRVEVGSKIAVVDDPTEDERGLKTAVDEGMKKTKVMVRFESHNAET